MGIILSIILFFCIALCVCGWARGIGKSKLRNKESWISEAKREKSFMEYLRGVFEANNGIENDPDLLVKLTASTLLELAQKELAESASPELEKAANEWLHKWDIDGIPTTSYIWEDMVDCFRAGAEWMQAQAGIDSKISAENDQNFTISSELDAEIDNYMNREFGEPWDGCRPVSSFDLRGMAWYFAEWQKAQMVKIPSSTDMIAVWENEELPMLREKDYQDAERMAYNAFLDGWARGMSKRAKSKLRDRESWISEAKREKSFMEYLRGVFEANNGVENDPDLLIALHGQTLFELAQKDLPDSSDFEAEWKRYTKSRKDDMRTKAVTMNVKEVAKHFADWQKKQDEKFIVDHEIYRKGKQNGIRYGMRLKEEQMKKEAVDAYVGRMCDINISVPTEDLGLKFNDKVKVLILKENE